MSAAKELSLKLTLEVIQISKELKIRHEYDLASQVFRAGCSIGANMREAQSPESTKDFIHKMKIAQKEAYETEYWLEVCELNSQMDVEFAKELCEALKKIIGKSISTAHKNLKVKSNKP